MSELLCPTCGGQKFCGLQYCLTSEDYDGVSEWICEGCGTRLGRWTKRVLTGGDIEPRYGDMSRLKGPTS